MSPKSNAAIAVTRFGLGARPGELAAAQADPQAWLTDQIRRDRAEQPQAALPDSAACVAEFVNYQMRVGAMKRESMPTEGPDVLRDYMMAQHGDSPLQAERRAAAKPLLQGVQDEIFARTLIGAATPSPFRERWTLFWSNHFTVATTKLESAVVAGAFEREAIRPFAFGRFEDMLVASSTHPGMLLYLDQARSAGPDSPAGRRRQMGLNENLAREILELHTLGADAGYTQNDVTEFARALTGYSIGGPHDPADRMGRFIFREPLHEPGARSVMGRNYPDGGEHQARAVLADLAADPHTAAHIARKLAIHFVADDPPPQLVEHLRTRFLDSGGDLAAVASALIAAPQAWEPQPRKFKTPNEFLLSSYRAAGVLPQDVAKDVVQPLTALGQRPFAAPQPNGWSDVESDWAAPDALVKRLAWASRFAAAHAPAVAAPVDAAAAALGTQLSESLRTAIARAESRVEAFTLLLMSPEFQRR
jgi:uncharacterized protein (DUF1800 family)